MADALERVVAEIGDRKSGEEANGVPAPGEDAKRLDGDGTRFSWDGHGSED